MPELIVKIEWKDKRIKLFDVFVIAAALNFCHAKNIFRVTEYVPEREEKHESGEG